MMKIPVRFCRYFICILLFLLMIGWTSEKMPQVYAAEDVVVVIDPGHGGENLGAEYGEYTEKEMTMVVAQAMRAELEKYEGVTVYLTHESTDDDLSLKERAEFAHSKNAAMTFSLHFNMSADHNLFGAEVWVSAFDQYYATGHTFAQIEMEALTGLGLYDRGIKTRLGDSGDDYYGIIRESRALGRDAVLIEHCHLDEVTDHPFYNQGVSQWEEFGRLDATAVAKYFQLRSEELDVDYSEYPVEETGVPTQVVKPDLTPPDVCSLELDSLDPETGEAVFTLSARDDDSQVLYYGYSLNGGASWQPLKAFPRYEAEVTFSVSLPSGRDIEFCAAAFNAYDRRVESDVMDIRFDPPVPPLVKHEGEVGRISGEEVLEEGETQGEAVTDTVTLEEVLKDQEDALEQSRRELQTYQILIAVLVGLVVLMMLLLVVRVIQSGKKRKRGRKGRKRK